jgi:hypothetical protein
MKFIVLLMALAHSGPVFAANKSCLPCFEYQDGWYNYYIKDGEQIVASSGLYGEESECKAVRSNDKNCRANGPSKPRKYCLECFEYQDGWYSYYIKDGEQIVAGSSLYGEKSECQAARIKDQICRAGGAR